MHYGLPIIRRRRVDNKRPRFGVSKDVYGNLESAFQEDRADQYTQENFIKASELEGLAIRVSILPAWISFFNRSYDAKVR